MLLKEKSSIWRPSTQMKTAPEAMKVVSADGVYLHLENGEKVIDGISSWWVTLHGHSNKMIAEAIYEQAKKLEHVIFADFVHEKAEELSQSLVKLLPDSLNHIFFSDNGSTSVEVAVKMAYQYWKNIGDTKRIKFMSFEDGYHGDTLGAMSVGARSVYNQAFEPLLFPVETVPFPETFLNDDNAEEKENLSIELLHRTIAKSPDEYAAIIIEPLIQGAGGMKMCRPSFLRKLSEVAKETNILLIFDEVMTGFGRTGTLFACDQAGAAPDLICLSKGLSGGVMPLAATVCTDRIFDAFYSDDIGKTFMHSHSFTGNPLGCAAGLASLDILEKEKKYQMLESWHLKNIEEFSTYPRIKNARVCGTIAAADIVVGDEEGYLNSIGARIKAECLKRGLFLRPLGNVIYLLPPYCISEDELQNCYRIITEVLNSN